MSNPRYVAPLLPNPADQTKEPHLISLKVLRLSRPTLTEHQPLSSPSNSDQLAASISPTAALAYPSASITLPSNPFTLTPLLTLPPAFGNAYVGETFSCTLCANNELGWPVPGGKKKDVVVTNVRIEAEMKTPSMTIPLDVAFASTSPTAATSSDSDSGQEETAQTEDPLSHPLSPTPTTANTQLSHSTQVTNQATDLGPSTSLQGIISFHLKEEGPHVLAVTISYSETGAMSGRVRSFRKLYQFIARPCLVVRTKITRLGGSPAAASDDGAVLRKKQKKGTWALEAQLENVGEDTIVLSEVDVETKTWCVATGLNWELALPPIPTPPSTPTARVNTERHNPILGPGDVQQVCFLISEISEFGDGDPEDGENGRETDVAGRLIMGLLSIGWRGAMGNTGSLSTGWLGSREL